MTAETADECMVKIIQLLIILAVIAVSVWQLRSTRRLPRNRIPPTQNILQGRAEQRKRCG